MRCKTLRQKSRLPRKIPLASLVLLEDGSVSANVEGTLHRANLILLPNLTLVNISKNVCIFLWYLNLHLCTNAKVITVAV